ncbi:DNA repair protein rhp54 [Hordeum vulgare]|nr:DNA repair protein rhp54 [Hordeum vulgare]
MDNDHEAAAAIASMASSVVATETRGKARAAQEEEEGVDARGADHGVGQEKGSEARAGCKGRGSCRRRRRAAGRHQCPVKAATRDALLYLGVNPSHHGLVNPAVVAAVVSTGSSAYPRMMLPESPRASCTQPIPGLHVYPQGSRFSGECLPEVSIVAPSMPASVTIDLNATPVAGGSSSGGMRRREREMPADMLTGARNLFGGMSVAVDNDTANRFLENMIFEGGRPRRFPLDHEFPEDYGLEEEDDDMDIDGEPLFEEELANQTAAGAKPKRKSKWTKAYTLTEDKLL